MILCFIFSALIVALDQFFKYWIVRTIEMGAKGPDIIPGVLGLTHWENDGAMLNILSGQQWLLAGVALVASVVLIMIILRYSEGFWGTLGLASVLGGTVGNLFDRIFNDGKVIDMFRTLFINFPIFNIADIFITLGFITFLLHFISLTIKIGKEGSTEEKKRSRYADDTQPAGATGFDRHPNAAPAGSAYAQAEAPETHVSAPYAAPAAAYAAVGQAEQPAAVQVAPVAPLEEDYSSLIGSYDSVTDTTPEISLTMEALEAEIGSLDVDYDVDELLREYGIEDDDISV